MQSYTIADIATIIGLSVPRVHALILKANMPISKGAKGRGKHSSITRDDFKRFLIDQGFDNFYPVVELLDGKTVTSFPRLYGTTDLANIFRRHPATITYWFKSGVLRSARLLGCQKTTAQWIADFKQSHAVKCDITRRTGTHFKQSESRGFPVL